MNYITWLEKGQQQKVPCAEILEDSRFAWRDRKVRTVRLAELYDRLGYDDFAERARTCATWLNYYAMEDGTRTLMSANFCQLRLCPMCTARRAKRAAYKLSQVLDMVESEHDAMFLFLTLTVRNVPGDGLADSLVLLTKSWDRLLHHKRIKKAVKGWFRAIEITRHDQEYHPHIHAILAVEPSYINYRSEDYIKHAEFVERWKMALKSDYKPSVRIQVVKAKGQLSGGRAAAVEAAKYAVKDSDYIDQSLPEETAAEIVRTYTNALHRRRLTAFGGWLKEAAQKLDAGDLENGDLVHVDDKRIREDVADLIETYNWHFGAGDYILSSRNVNPLKVVRAEK